MILGRLHKQFSEKGQMYFITKMGMLFDQKVNTQNNYPEIKC